MALDYATLKLLHVTCAVATGSLFVLRGVWRFTDSVYARAGWVKVVPHVIDTVLLASAAGMAWTLASVPTMRAFLLTKAVALCGYILLGLIAFRFGRTGRVRLAAWIGAQAMFIYLVGVAITKSPTLTLLGSLS